MGGWTMVFFSYFAYLILNNLFELLHSFPAQPNTQQNVELKLRGDSAKGLCMCTIQMLTLKPFTLKIYLPFLFFSFKMTILIQCI